MIKQTLSLLIVIAITSCNSESAKINSVTETKYENGLAESTFKVWGNCGMCEEKIETSLKVDGVNEADWDSETKIITVLYDTNKISLDKIHKNIVGVGYDTDKYKSEDSTYSNLHECCKYDRK